MLRRKVVMHPNAREISSDSVHSVVSLREAAGNAGIDACVTIGRTSGNVLSLDHQDLPLLISRKHATIMLQEDGSVTLKDLGATNGTWVNEIRLPSMGSATLQPGDMVSFGGPACIMREGVPIRNPFMYEFQPVVPAAADFDAGINDGPAAMYDSPARIPSYPVASGPEIAGQESREGLQIDSLPGRVDISVRQILNDNFSSDDSPMEAEEVMLWPGKTEMGCFKL